MAFQFDLGNGQLLYVTQWQEQTAIALMSSRPGQQQSQKTSFTTGIWQVPPTLFQTPSGYILRIEARQGQSFLQIQSSGIQQLSAIPPLIGAERLVGREIPNESSPFDSSSSTAMNPMPPMEPMQPMQPMQMGDMQMQMNPMRMQMGDMTMQIGKVPQPSRTAEPMPPEQVAVRQFCPQCGQNVGPSDRFCAYCGHRLIAE